MTNVSTLLTKYTSFVSVALLLASSPSVKSANPSMRSVPATKLDSLGSLCLFSFPTLSPLLFISWNLQLCSLI